MTAMPYGYEIPSPPTGVDVIAIIITFLILLVVLSFLWDLVKREEDGSA